jgi:hypothetical protein
VQNYNKHKKELKAFQLGRYKDSIAVEAGLSLQKEVGDILPQSGNLFYRLFLGHGDIRMYSPLKRLEFKDEYEHYKVRTHDLSFGFVGSFEL